MHRYNILNCSVISTYILQKRFYMSIYNPRMKWSVITLFVRVMNTNVELCPDWLFHRMAQCWALPWLAVSQNGSMLSSALIGCFTEWLNVELCPDWLFHRMAQCWALLWLAVSQNGSMLSSALIGCFTVQLISVAHTAGRKHREHIYFNTFSCSYIVEKSYCKYNSGIRELLLICWALFLNAQLLFSFTFTFEIRNRMYSVYTMEWQYLPHILQDQMIVSGAQDL